MQVIAGAEPSGRFRPGGPGEPAQPYDFRRPDRFDVQAVRSLEAAHEIFTRRVASAWGAALRGVVNLELAAVDQVTYDDYIRSLPSPDLIAVLSLSPLPGPVLVDCTIELALQLLDRLLGAGSATGSSFLAARRPTDLESVVLSDLMRRTAPALEETLSSFLPVEGELVGVEYNPQLVQASAPSDSVLLLTFVVEVNQGLTAGGMLTVCYPVAAATALVDRISAQLRSSEPGVEVDEAWQAALEAGLREMGVDLRIALDETTVPARDLAALAVGDVLRLDHRLDQPVRGRVEGREVLAGHLGRRGRRLAVQVLQPPTRYAPINRSST